MPIVIKPIRNDLQKFLIKRNLFSRYRKQARLFETNPAHPSLHTEVLEPKNLRIYSFRIDRKYRAIFIYLGSNEIEVIDINRHYND